MLTSYGEDDKVAAAIKAGAHGSVRKSTSSSWLLQTVRSLYHSMHPTLNATTARKLMRELNRPTVLPPADKPLTEREAQILILIARGLTISIIADRFFMHEQTVYAHINSILNKYHYFFGRTSDED
jgi:DNA-binding NarL/FixJ family response regulator